MTIVDPVNSSGFEDAETLLYRGGKRVRPDGRRYASELHRLDGTFDVTTVGEETQFTCAGNDNALLQPPDTAALIGDVPVEAGRDGKNDVAQRAAGPPR